MYCVKCKQETQNQPGSEHIVTTKNNRKQLKAKCSVCGTTKNRFLPNSYNGPTQGEGIWDFIIANPNLVNAAVGALQAAPAVAGLAYGAKKIYDATRG